MAKSLKKIKYQIKELEPHLDGRGWLVEMLKRNEMREDIKQIYVASIKPGAVRGNHYHLKRTEWFFLIGDKAEFYLEDLRSGKRINLKLSSKRPRLVTVFPGVAHALKNTGKKTIYLVSAQNTVYNPKNPDTYEYQIIAS
jgi:dTDP-4-dehydrorhamnose 3,5-epimerase-like enzyme